MGPWPRRIVTQELDEPLRCLRRRSRMLGHCINLQRFIDRNRPDLDVRMMLGIIRRERIDYRNTVTVLQKPLSERISLHRQIADGRLGSISEPRGEDGPKVVIRI